MSPKFSCHSNDESQAILNGWAESISAPGRTQVRAASRNFFAQAIIQERQSGKQAAGPAESRLWTGREKYQAFLPTFSAIERLALLS